MRLGNNTEQVQSASALGTDWIGCERIGHGLGLLASGRCADLRNRSVGAGRLREPQPTEMNSANQQCLRPPLRKQIGPKLMKTYHVGYAIWLRWLTEED